MNAPALVDPGIGSEAWADACLAGALFAVDPVGLGGVILRGGPGRARDRWVQMVRLLLPEGAPVGRIPAHIEDDRLLGGLDLSASLAAGRPVAQRGVLAESDGGIVILAMAERVEIGVGARLAAVLDRSEVIVERDGMASRLPARIGLIALDEGLTPEERPPDALRERLAFRLDMDAIGAREPMEADYDVQAVADARLRLDHVAPADLAIVEALCKASDMLGVRSARAPLLTLRAARAHAALHGRTEITAEDAAEASRLVLGPRALTAPVEAPPEQPSDDPESSPEPPPSDAAEDEPANRDDAETDSDAPSDSERVVEAIQAALPDDLLARLASEGSTRATASNARGSGAAAKSANRGRPVGSRSGGLRAGARLNLVETLRAAAPWQTVRKTDAGNGRVQVRPADFRIRRFVKPLEATTIFVVDASGSTAFQRLAEAKGAVELLLAKAYVARARVALIAFRGSEAELLLPPTRSLTRAKNRLADLPGGGGTPLASAMDAALVLAQAEKAKTRTPLLVFLTDGRANIGRDGAPGRAAAEADALAAARQVGEAGIASVFIDTSPRAQPGGDRFAQAMAGVYAPLPYVEAGAVASIVGDMQGGRR